MKDHVQSGSVFNALRSPNDPIRSLKRSMRITWLIGVVVIAGFALWGWRPLNDLNQGVVSIELREPPSELPDSPRARFDKSAFTAKLWNPRSPEVSNEVVAQRTVPSKLLRLQLVGIIDDGQSLRAAVYDPETDRLLILASGERVHHHTVTSITADAIELANGRSSHRLTLREEGS